jgi:hypothetical protein
MLRSKSNLAWPLLLLFFLLTIPTRAADQPKIPLLEIHDARYKLDYYTRAERFVKRWNEWADVLFGNAHLTTLDPKKRADLRRREAKAFERVKEALAELDESPGRPRLVE